MKLLCLDIETAPATALVWGLRDENIGLEQVVEPGRVLCWAARWHGERKVHFADERGGAKKMFAAIHALLSEADASITYNGLRFDIPKLNGGFVEYGLPPAPPIAHIDLFLTVRQMGWLSSKLAFVGPHLKIGEKIKHEGFSLWRKCLDGDDAAWKRMRRYCEKDTRLLSPLYESLKGFIKTHPHLGLTGATACPRCQSSRTQSRGFRRTRAMHIQRVQCINCGGWFDGKRSKA